jgi:signal transduction histidine kinase
MVASICIIAAEQSTISKIIALLDKQTYRTTCFTGKSSLELFLAQAPETVDLLILDGELYREDNTTSPDKITPETTPVLFLTGPDNPFAKATHRLKRGWYDFIDPESDLQFLEARVSVLLKVQALQKRLDRAASDNSFVADMSHDLRNPLHGVLSYAKFGIKKGESGQLTAEKSRHYYQNIKTSGNRLSEMLEDLIFLAKLNVGRIQFDICRRDLGTVTLGVISTFSKAIEESQLSIAFDEPTNPVQGHFDSRQISSVIHRFVSSCLQSAEAPISLSLAAESLDPASTTYLILNQPAIRFSLQQQEAGISDQRLNDIQTIFSQGGRLKSGLGQIGLNFAVCQRIIARHGGHIQIDSDGDNSIILEFILPIKQPSS